MKQRVVAAELLAALHDNPEDEKAWAVYGDWLQSVEDVRGEIIALELGAQTDSSLKRWAPGR